MRRLITALSSVKLTFWLVLAISALLFIGAHYTGREFSLFTSLNETTLPAWLSAQTSRHFGVLWWIFALCLASALIGLNALCCLALRVESLLARRHEMSWQRLSLLLVPSVVHLLFFLLLLGHLLTFTTGDWKRVKAIPSASIPLPVKTEPFVVASLDHQYLTRGLLKERLARTTVKLRGKSSGRNIEVSHLKPAVIDGHTVLLTISPRASRVPQVKEKGFKNCDGPPTPAPKSKEKPPPELLVVSDPGFDLIITSWFAAVVLMGWFFIRRGPTGGA